MSKIIGTNGLMKHLRDKHNISIKGSVHKRKLRNYGYYHGFKGYRYIGNVNNKIPFSDFDQIVAFNTFDMQLKSIFYPHIMFIETALKNYVLEQILIASNSNSFVTIYNAHINLHKNYRPHEKQYKEKLKKKLRLRNQIYSVISREYGNDKRIVKHFYDKDIQIPVWAIFELITMGEFGAFVACLNSNIKKSISKSINLNQSCDSNGELTEKIIYLLKDLRNSIAHNYVIFDVRFKSSKPNKALIQNLSIDTKITGIDFSTILDYFILMIYLLKKFQVSKTVLRQTIKAFESNIDEFRSQIYISIYNKIFHTNTRNKLNTLKEFI